MPPLRTYAFSIGNYLIGWMSFSSTIHLFIDSSIQQIFVRGQKCSRHCLNTLEIHLSLYFNIYVQVTCLIQFLNKVDTGFPINTTPIKLVAHLVGPGIYLFKTFSGWFCYIDKFRNYHSRGGIPRLLFYDISDWLIILVHLKLFQFKVISSVRYEAKFRRWQSLSFLIDNNVTMINIL